MQQTLVGCAFCDAPPGTETGEAHAWGKDERVTHPICVDCAIQTESDPDDFAERNDTERIVRFLGAHDDRAWKAAMIADRLDLETDAVSAILSRLKDRGLVRHKRPYWAITDDTERLRSAYRLHRHHERADDQYGAERLEGLRTDEMDPIQ